MAKTKMDLLKTLPRFKDVGLKVEKSLVGGRSLIITKPDGGRENWQIIPDVPGCFPKGALRYGGGAYLKWQDLP